MVCTRRKTAAPAARLPDLASHPSEEELIASYLRPRVVSGDRMAATFIHDADIYAATPAELTGGFDPAVASNGDRAWYFFSAVRAKTRDGQRKARTVDSGEGCWHSEAGAKPVVGDDGRRLGQRQSFSFVTKVDGRRVRSGWLMVELSLGDDADGGMALCKIYFSPRARVDGGARATAAAAGAASAPDGRNTNKRKAAADHDKNPAASAARQRRVNSRRPANEAGVGAQHDDDVATADAEGRRGGHTGESSAADGPEALWTDDSSFSRWMRDRDRWVKEYNIVDRPDEEIQRDYGIDQYLRLLDHKYDDLYL